MTTIAVLAPEGALVDIESIYNTPIERRKTDLKCVDCGKQLIFERKRTSENDTERFRHADPAEESSCAQRYCCKEDLVTPENSGAWHTAMCQLIQPLKRDVVRSHPSKPEVKCVVDAYCTTADVGFQFQHSDIQPEEMRNLDESASLNWIFNMERCTLHPFGDIDDFAFLEIPTSWCESLPDCSSPALFCDQSFKRIYRCVGNETKELHIPMHDAPLRGCLVHPLDAGTIYEELRLSAVSRLTKDEFTAVATQSADVPEHWISFDEVSSRNVDEQWLFPSAQCKVHYSEIGCFYVVCPRYSNWESAWNNMGRGRVFVGGGDIPLLRIECNESLVFQSGDDETKNGLVKGFLAVESKRNPQEDFFATLGNTTKSERHTTLLPESMLAKSAVDPLLRQDFIERKIPSLLKNEKLAIAAPAGSGKTTLLKQAIDHLPRNKRVLYITYNKQLQMEMVEKCRGYTNVDARTFDSIVYRIAKTHAESLSLGGSFDQQLDRSIWQSFRETFPDIAEYLKDKRYANPYAGNAMDTALNVVIARFNAFCADPVALRPQDHKDYNFEIIKKMWTKTQQFKWITYSGIRKYVQLSQKMKGLIDDNYDFVFVDEVQDLNAVMLDVIDNQVTVPGVYVGDPYQSIYGFNGDVNLFKQSHWEARVNNANGKRRIRLNLYQTFRFGSPLCSEKHLLYWFPGVQIVPNQELTTTVTVLSKESSDALPTQYVYLFRTWDALINHLVDQKIHETAVPVSIPGLERRIPQWRAMLKLSPAFRKNFQDVDMQTMPSAFEKLGPTGFENLCEKLRRIQKPGMPMQYSTIHQWKGREADVIRIAGDVLVDWRRPVESSVLGDEECLFYVALTRARRQVFLDPRIPRADFSDFGILFF
eukprot:gb/GECG01013399.1/.p1 GENE.gb/GECG01013399.1/~~gb/GECG01013399.1/.p1  ORF type:complete len:875 (+),score=93.06 gb/GECG01013399.1/:1-2625(+)